jgi:hypothetical protein
MVNLFVEIEDRKVLLSTLWIFAMFNYIYADILTFFEPGMLEELMTGSVGGIEFTQVFLLGASVLMETAIAMVLLSRVLKYKVNRLANIIAGTINTLSVLLSMFVGTPSLHYIFFGTIEMATTLLIIKLAWTWTNPGGD